MAKRNPPQESAGWGIYDRKGSLVSDMGDLLVYGSEREAEGWAESDQVALPVRIVPVPRATRKPLTE